MSVTDELLANNAAYAANFHGPLPLPPAKHVAVVACMDARINVYGVLGLNEGEAHVIRNAGGVITEDEIRSLAISQRLLGTEEIILIHHTDCGMLTFTDDEFKKSIQDETGIKPAWAAEAFGDLDADVRQSIARIKASPFVPKKDSIRGFVFDVATGRAQRSGVARTNSTIAAASSGPASSCRKCPALAITGCSRPAAPGIVRCRIGPIAPVIGSRSENATSIGVGTGGERLPGRAVRLARRVVGTVGHEPGHRPRAGLERLVRERRVVRGAGLVGQRPHAAGLHEPADVECRRVLDGLAEPVPHLGHVDVAGGQPGVGGHDAGEAVGMLGGQAQPDQAAPVLADQRDRAQVEDVEGERAHPLDVLRVAVVGHLGRLVRTAEADQVGRDHPQSGVGQHRDHAAVQERPGRFAVQQQHRFAVGGAVLDPGHPQPVDLGVVRRVVEVGQLGESLVRRTQGVHAVTVTRLTISLIS